MTCGSRLSRFCRERRRVSGGRPTIGCFLRPYSGGFAGGCRRIFLSVCSASYRMVSMYRSIGSSYKLLQRLLGSKKEIKRRYRPFKGWFDAPDRGVDRYGWGTGPFCCSTEPEPRSHGNTRPSPGPFM